MATKVPLDGNEKRDGFIWDKKWLMLTTEDNEKVTPFLKI